MKNCIYYGDILEILEEMSSESFDLIYINLPSRMKKNSSYIQKNDIEDYLSIFDGYLYDGRQADYLLGIAPILIEAKRILRTKGVLYVRGSVDKLHYIKAVLLDKIFRRNLFYNEIVWVTDEKKGNGLWPTKHENLLMYVNSLDFEFLTSEVDRIDYMAPALQTKDKREKKKFPTDTWWSTQIGENEMLRRLIVSSVNSDENVLGIMTGDSIFAQAASESKRNFTVVEKSKVAMETLQEYFINYKDIKWVGKKLNGK